MVFYTSREGGLVDDPCVAVEECFIGQKSKDERQNNMSNFSNHMMFGSEYD
jgi:hypothetical protein